MLPCPPGSFAYKLQRGDTLYDLAKLYKTTVSNIFAVNPGLVINNLRIGQTICIPGMKQGSAEVTQQSLHDQWRVLWEQHVAWTRMVILADIFDAPDLTDSVNRLLRNPADMAAVIKRYYGQANAEKFEQLMHDHLSIALDLVNAAKAGDSNAAADAEKKWYANADAIAAFLARINPNWPLATLKDMLHRHLALTKEEAVAILNKDYGRSINLYGQIEQQALEMADAMTNGIVKQFPGMLQQGR